MDSTQSKDEISSRTNYNLNDNSTEKIFGSEVNELKFVKILLEKFRQGKFEKFFTEKLTQAYNDTDMNEVFDSFNCEDKTKFYELDDDIFKKMVNHMLYDS